MNFTAFQVDGHRGDLVILKENFCYNRPADQFPGWQANFPL